MSTRVLNPAATLMTEIIRIGSASTPPRSTGRSSIRGRVQPSREALAMVKRDLFGPVDHVAARAMAEDELEAQSIQETERWGFDFRLEMPKNGSGSRFEWEIVTANDDVPEPYAWRGMPYTKKSMPSSPKKSSSAMLSPRTVRIADDSLTIPTPVKVYHSMCESERTPPQESCNLGSLTTTAMTKERNARVQHVKQSRRSCTSSSSTTPGQMRKQMAITDFMKCRKRTLNGSSKGLMDSPPASKVARKNSQILS
ncbi:uncharacterized protein LOC106645130 isoform X2 [Copidosoma floridanum]|nr:uncharacterized protein LOC106645130 isoform X2 [Copidosoma floridanum]